MVIMDKKLIATLKKGLRKYKKEINLDNEIKDESL